jgi:hypothetical protein
LKGHFVCFVCNKLRSISITPPSTEVLEGGRGLRRNMPSSLSENVRRPTKRARRGNLIKCFVWGGTGFVSWHDGGLLRTDARSQASDLYSSINHIWEVEDIHLSGMWPEYLSWRYSKIKIIVKDSTSSSVNSDWRNNTQYMRKRNEAKNLSEQSRETGCQNISRFKFTYMKTSFQGVVWTNLI